MKHVQKQHFLFKTASSMNVGFSCWQTNYKMLHKFPRMNSPLRILTNLGLARLVLERDQKRVKKEAKP